MVPGDGAILSLWISELVGSLINIGLNDAAFFLFVCLVPRSETPVLLQGDYSFSSWLA